MTTRLLIFMLLVCCVVRASEVDKTYQEALSRGGYWNQSQLQNIVNTDTSKINHHVEESAYESELTDKMESRSFALSKGEVKEQMKLADHTIRTRSLADAQLMEKAAVITNDPDNYTTGEGLCNKNDCQQESGKDHSDDMLRGVAALDNMLGGGASYSHSPDLRIYSGEAYRCQSGDSFNDAINCCESNKGWLSVHIKFCKPEDKKLAEKKEKMLCHRVGEYEEEYSLDPFSVFKKTYESYCCFPSEMAKITQVSGHQQLKKSWGKPKRPNCRGFTSSEFSRLDFSKINLEPIYDDIVKNMKLPDPSEMTQQASGHGKNPGG